jgi:predicted DNA-binding transcriptional regulator AlpA
VSTKQENPIPPWNRLAVDAKTAATMFSIGRSTFFARVKRGDLPKPASDGLWRVSDLQHYAEATRTTTPSVPA